ncbi:uncharacterized protein LOC133776022 [Lepus europaeus]|uniref:uncharacterized protein LOC133757831 n=1 Tax=Lepus europaeus TaxID=9983 RepID=UPI002B48A416|nr:uncharacterized protein LOC133757831 [Lepus europaeus]XP_062070662.1 uncharacterized protein LOC133776022 [Lepus europaeus]
MCFVLLTVYVCAMVVLFVWAEILIRKGQQITTPLSLTLDHWKDVRERARHLSVEVKKKQWARFCSSEWPAFEVGWPRNGTFNLDIILQIKERVFRPGSDGHPDQVAYITTWEDLSRNPPPWIEPFFPTEPIRTPIPPPPIPVVPTSSLFPLKEIRGPKPDKPPVLPADQDFLLLDSPPPYLPSQPAPPQEPPLQPERDVQPSAPSPDSTREGEEVSAPSPPSSRLRLRRGQAGGSGSVWTSQAFPLRSVAGQMQYWPFSASDLYNWKTHNPSFSQDPQALTGLIESILLTHQPTWDDCQQLLQTLLTTEEKQRVYLEARKNVPGADGRPTLLPNEIEEAFPLTRPDWDYTTVAGRERLRLYRQVLLAGLRGAGKRPTNLAKVRAVVQGAEETPAGFLERLMEAYRMYTPFDPLAEDRQGDVIMSFIGQSAPDIRNKLQRLEGLQGYTIQDLMKEAERIYNKKDPQGAGGKGRPALA